MFLMAFHIFHMHLETHTRSHLFVVCHIPGIWQVYLFKKKLCLHILGIWHGYPKSICLYMVHPLPIFLNFQTNISKCLILYFGYLNFKYNQNVCAWYILFLSFWTFRQIFRNILSYGYLNSKYFYQEYPWNIFIPFRHGPLPPWEPCCSFWPGLPWPVAAPFTTVMCHSSVAATDRPPRRGCPTQTAS